MDKDLPVLGLSLMVTAGLSPSPPCVPNNGSVEASIEAALKVASIPSGSLPPKHQMTPEVLLDMSIR